MNYGILKFDLKLFTRLKSLVIISLWTRICYLGCTSFRASLSFRYPNTNGGYTVLAEISTHLSLLFAQQRYANSFKGIARSHESVEAASAE
jgi:hypothetical protein